MAEQVFAVDEQGRTVHFRSSLAHCTGCVIDREAGCDDIKGCCCTHQKEYKREWEIKANG